VAAKNDDASASVDAFDGIGRYVAGGAWMVRLSTVDSELAGSADERH
jgi:hypothetical protein